jgi:formylglycine-generating enzyme required for sulfatase activity
MDSKSMDSKLAKPAPRWRYPGSVSFSDNDADRSVFFGRDVEVQEVLNGVLSNQVLVLYAKSGLGKTSLLQAGLFPLLRECNLLPIRLRFVKANISLLEELHESAKATCAELSIDFTPGEGATLWEYLNTALFSKGDYFLTPVLVLDQFEEVFTLQTPEYRAALAQQLGSVVNGQIPSELRERLLKQVEEGKDSPAYLATPPKVRMLLSLREEYVGMLQELSQALPGILNQRFRLGPLLMEHARAAIEKPAALPDAERRFQTYPFSFAEGTVDDVLQFFVKGKKHSDIEPFQLQVLCHHAERQVALRQEQTPDNVVVDTQGYFGGEAGMERVLQQFYREALSKVSGWWQRRKARILCEKGLLSPEPGGHRESLGKGQIERQYGIKQATLDELVGMKVLRGEHRLENFSYELSHDSLAKAVRKRRQQAATRNRWSWSVSMLLLAGWGGVTYFQSGNIEQEALANEQAYLDLIKEQALKDPADTMVEIPTGTFAMGSENGRENEKPRHMVRVAGFMLSDHEVTFAEYDKFVAESRGTDNEMPLPKDQGWGRGNRPVINVSWEEANAYIAWLNSNPELNPARPYRLATEAEWEYAARGNPGVTDVDMADAVRLRQQAELERANAVNPGAGPMFQALRQLADEKEAALSIDELYFWGDTITCEQARYGHISYNSECGNDEGTVEVKTTGVANDFRLYDMHGNVYEWVQDCYHENYDPILAPTDGSAWEESGCELRVLRGGSWFNSPDYLRSAYRFWSAPGTRSNSAGFRLAQDR